MNPQSPVVQSFLSITKSLSTVTDAVSRIEQLRKLEESKSEFGQGVPPGPNVLMKLLKHGAVAREAANSRADLQLTSHESEAVKGLVNAGLVFEK